MKIVTLDNLDFAESFEKDLQNNKIKVKARTGASQVPQNVITKDMLMEIRNTSGQLLYYAIDPDLLNK